MDLAQIYRHSAIQVWVIVLSAKFTSWSHRLSSKEMILDASRELNLWISIMDFRTLSVNVLSQLISEAGEGYHVVEWSLENTQVLINVADGT